MNTGWHVIENCKGQGRVVFVSGNFNILHVGHLRLLKFAADCGDKLVVGLNGDSTPGVLVPAEDRLEGLKAISIVNECFVLDETVESFIRRLKPAVVVKGKEHEDLYNAESSAVEAYGGKLLFSSGDSDFSSLELLRKHEKERPFLKQPRDYLERHSLKPQDLRTILARFQELKVIVIGDLIVDEYITCDPLGMSREDPTIVVTPVMEDIFLGGSGIVAAHARGLGAKVTYLSICGDDSAAVFARERLTAYNVESHLFKDDSRMTTVKTRYRAQGKTLLRVSRLKQHAISEELEKQLFERFMDVLSSASLVIFSDFNYGCLSQSLVDQMIQECKQRKIFMVADSQSSSQIGDISRFHDMTLLTPTEHEVRVALKDNQAGLVVLAENLRHRARAQNVIVTLGSLGALVHAPASGSDNWITDELPALNSAPKDNAGAGDALLTSSGLAIASGASIWQAAYVGSVAAACQVARQGNIPLTLEELAAQSYV